MTTVSRCYDCGRASVLPGGGVGVRYSDGVGGFAGLSTCGRIWLCPVCNAKVMARRAVEIGAMLTWAAVEGYHVIWGSLTCRHDASSDLLQLIDVQRGAWRKVVQSRYWKRHAGTQQVPHEHSERCATDCEKKLAVKVIGDGRIGYVRASELTIGRNGWHPHFHPIIIYRGTETAAQDFADGLVGAWQTAVSAMGGEAYGYGAQQLRVVSGLEAQQNLSGYVTKATYDAAKKDLSGLAMEAVWSQGKTGRGRALSTSSHWSLLADIESGLWDAAERWGQLEEATVGHRMITWSRGLRDLAGLGVELEDEEIAAEELGSDADTLCVITPEGWQTLRDDPAMLADLLTVVEAGGWVGLRIWLDLRGIEWIDLADMAAQHDENRARAEWSKKPDPHWAGQSEKVPDYQPGSVDHGPFASHPGDDDFWLYYAYEGLPPELDRFGSSIGLASGMP